MKTGASAGTIALATEIMARIELERAGLIIDLSNFE
jgi:hypothetical protein